MKSTKEILLLTAALIYQNALRHGGNVEKAKKLYEAQKEDCQYE